MEVGRATVAALLGGGVPLGGLAWAASRFMGVNAESSNFGMSDLVGVEADVTMDIQDGGFGIVRYSYAGTSQTAHARAATGGPIPVGARVVITNLQGSMLVVSER